MALDSRFFVIKEDQSSTPVTAQELDAMRAGGRVGPHDKVIPAPFADVPLRTFLSASDDLDTAPLHLHASQSFESVHDEEIERAFSVALSESFYQLEAEPAQQVGASLHVRLKDGRVLGPYDQNAIWQKIKNRVLSGQEEFSEAVAGDFRPLREFPFFYAALELFGRRESTATFQRHELDVLGISPILLRLAKEQKSGWLKVQSGDCVKVMSIVRGAVYCVYSDASGTSAKEEVAEVFSLTNGDALFEESVIAERDSNSIAMSTVKLCREQTLVTAILTDQARYLCALDGQDALISTDEMTDTERRVVVLAQGGKPLREIAQILRREQPDSSLEIERAIMMMCAARATYLADERPLREVYELADCLLSSGFLALVPLSLETRETQIEGILDAVRERIRAAIKSLPMGDPLRQKMRDRFETICEWISDPVERFIILRAKEMGVDIEHDAELHRMFEREYLRSAIPRALDEKKYSEILPYAEHYQNLFPSEAEAKAWVLLAQIYAGATSGEQNAAFKGLVKLCKQEPDVAEVQLAGAEASIVFGRLRLFRKLLRRLDRLSPGDGRVERLKELMRDPIRCSKKRSYRRIGAFIMATVTVAAAWVAVANYFGYIDWDYLRNLGQFL